MLPVGKNFNVVTIVRGKQLVFSVYGDSEQLYECAFRASLGMVDGQEKLPSTDSIGLNQVTSKTVASLDTYLSNWLREVGHPQFATDTIYQALIDVFKKAGYKFK